MPGRKRVYTSTSPLRHKAKMERVFLGKVTEPTGVALATAINAEWERGFGTYKEAYRKLKEWLAQAHPDVPRGLYGLYRSFLFKAMKEIPSGADPQGLINEFASKCGLDPNVLAAILEYFGLAQVKSGEEVSKSH